MPKSANAKRTVRIPAYLEVKDGTFAPVMMVLKSSRLRHEATSQALSELQRWINRYGRVFGEFGQILLACRHVKEQHRTSYRPSLSMRARSVQ